MRDLSYMAAQSGECYNSFIEIEKKQYCSVFFLLPVQRWNYTKQGHITSLILLIRWLTDQIWEAHFI